MLLPALAIAAQAIARRWRFAAPALAVLFLIAVPANGTMFGDAPFGKRYFATERRVLTNITRVPAAKHAPSLLRPISDPYIAPTLDMSFLRNAVRTGRLHPSTAPIPPADRLEYELRLGLDQRVVAPSFAGCERRSGIVDLTPAKGSSFRFYTVMAVTLLEGDTRSNPVFYDPAAGAQLRVVASGMHLRLHSADGSGHLSLCGL
jgi:hypothetical protein